MVGPRWRAMARSETEYYAACQRQYEWSELHCLAFSFKKGDTKSSCNVNCPTCNAVTLPGQYKSKYSDTSAINILYILYIYIWSGKHVIKKYCYWHGLMDHLATLSKFHNIPARFSWELFLPWTSVCTIHYVYAMGLYISTLYNSESLNTGTWATCTVWW